MTVAVQTIKSGVSTPRPQIEVSKARTTVQEHERESRVIRRSRGTLAEKETMPRFFRRPAWLVAAALVLSGCTSVAPWERGNLAKPHMALNPHPMQSVLRAHTYGSREAASGGSVSAEGGGCGCY